MIRAIFRAGFLIGAASAVTYLARKYYKGDFDELIDKAKSTAKDIGVDFAQKDEVVTSSMKKAM